MRYFRLLALLIFLSGCSGLKADVDPVGVKSGKDTSAIKVDEAEQVQNEVSLLRGKVTGIKSDVDEINSKIQAQMQGIAGVNNKLKSLSAGRDIINQTETDPEIIKLFLKYWYLIFLAIIGLMKWKMNKMEKSYNKQINRIIEEKETWRDYFIAEKIENEKELDEFREKHNV